MLAATPKALWVEPVVHGGRVIWLRVRQGMGACECSTLPWEDPGGAGLQACTTRDGPCVNWAVSANDAACACSTQRKVELRLLVADVVLVVAGGALAECGRGSAAVQASEGSAGGGGTK